MRNINRTVWELLIGIGLCGMILEIAGVMLVQRKLYYTAGLGIGLLLAVFMTFSIHASVVRAVDAGESRAKMKMIASYSLRTILVVAALAATGVLGLGNIVGALLGLMTLKVAAYLQPFTHKFLAGGKE